MFLVIFEFQIQSKKLGFEVFKIGEECCHQLMEEILGIWNSRLHIVKLGFQFYRFGGR